jgi:hypothetical protein
VSAYYGYDDDEEWDDPDVAYADDEGEICSIGHCRDDGIDECGECGTPLCHFHYSAQGCFCLNPCPTPNFVMPGCEDEEES